MSSDPLQNLNSPTQFASALRRRNRSTAVLLIVLAVVIAALVITGMQARDAEGDAKDARDSAAQDRAQLAQALDLQRNQFRYCTQPANLDKAVCARPATPNAGQVVAGEDGAAGSPGSTGAAGPAGRAPTATEIAGAVRTYCSTGACVGQPTQGQVDAAVTSYCAGARCRGPSGTNGPSGATGAPGTAGQPGDPGAQGPTGPAPTDAQVAAAVADYCADDVCRGPQGPAGPPGDQGTARPGSYACPDDQYVTGFDVGTGGDVTLDCRPLPGLLTP